ncbi:MAG: hypothetical protein ACFB14_22770 [Leptolyngbyaceae cyanobacterium]
MYDLTQFSLQNATYIGADLRRLGQGADSLETVAQRSVRYFYNKLIDPHNGQSACALVRFFKTHPYKELPAELQAYTAQLNQPRHTVLPDVKCLTLLATAGDQASWNDRRLSQGHQVIPLTSAEGIQEIPMISQLIHSFGLDINNVVAPEPSILIELERKTFNVFFIPNALNSEFIPDQNSFVSHFKIKSVLGFGGMLPSGNLFAIILFTKVAIPESTARLFKALPLNIKMAVIPFDIHQTFGLQAST